MDVTWHRPTAMLANNDALLERDAGITAPAWAIVEARLGTAVRKVEIMINAANA